MPLLKLETNVTLSEEQRKTILSSLSAVVAATIGKPEQYVMVTVGPAEVLMSGKPGAGAFVEIRSLGGLSAEVNRKLSEQVCQLLRERLGIPPDRVYLNFTDLKAANWGWDGETFG